jgi:hypothetical protein
LQSFDGMSLKFSRASGMAAVAGKLDRVTCRLAIRAAIVAVFGLQAATSYVLTFFTIRHFVSPAED